MAMPWPCHGPGDVAGIETTAEGHGRAGGRGEDVERHLAPAFPAQGRRPAETRDPVRITFFSRGSKPQRPKCGGVTWYNNNNHPPVITIDSWYKMV